MTTLEQEKRSLALAIVALKIDLDRRAKDILKRRAASFEEQERMRYALHHLDVEFNHIHRPMRNRLLELMATEEHDNIWVLHPPKLRHTVMAERLLQEVTE